MKPSVKSYTTVSSLTLSSYLAPGDLVTTVAVAS